MSSDTTQKNKQLRSRKAGSLATGVGLASAGLLSMTAQQAAAQSVPSNFVELDTTKFSVEFEGGRATITGPGGSINVPVGQVRELLDGSLFVAENIQAAIVDAGIGASAGVGGIGAAGAAVGGLAGLAVLGAAGGPSNAAPTVTQPLADVVVGPGGSISQTVTFADPEGSPLTLSALLSNGNPLSSVGLSFDPNTGLISGTLAPNVGDTTVVITASDGTDSTTESFFINVNVAPVAGTIANQTATTGQATNITAVSAGFSDQDGDALTYSATLAGGAALSTVGLSIDSATGVISGTFTGTADVTINVTATDGNAPANTSFLLEANAAPTVTTGYADATVTTNTAFSGGATFADSDGDTMTYSATLAGGAALSTVGLSIDANTGVVSGTFSGANDVTVNVTASDGNGGTVVDSFDIDANAAPTVTAGYADDTITTGTPFTGSATFADADGDTLTYTAALAGGGTLASVGLSIDANTGVVSGNFTSTADVTVNVTANDGNGGTIVDSFDIDASAAPTVTTGYADAIVTTGAAFSGNAVFADADGDTISYSATLAGGAALSTVGLSIDATTGVVSGTFTGTNDVTVNVVANDGNGGTVSDSFDIDANAHPTVTTGYADDTVTTGTAFSGSATFADLDGDTLTYTAALSGGGTLASVGLSIDANSGVVSGTFTGIADVTIDVTASDGNGGSVVDSFDIDASGPPTVTTGHADATVTTGTAFSSSATFADADGDTLTYTATIAGSGAALSTVGLAIDSGTGVISGTFSGTNDITINVTANDGNGGTVVDSFDIVANAAPTVTTGYSDDTVTTGTAYSNSATFADTDGDSLTYSATLAGGAALSTVGLAIDSNTGVVSTANFTGTADVTVDVTANDGNGASVTDSFDIDANAAPTVVAPNPDVLVVTGSAISLTGLNAAFGDTDGDTLTTSATLQGGAALSTVGLAFDAANGVISGTFTGANNVIIEITATDGNVSVTDSFSLGDNIAPTVSTAIADATVTTGDTFSDTVVFADADGDLLTTTAQLSDGSALSTVGLSYNPSNGLVSGTFTGTNDTTVEITATDPDGASVTDSFDITANAAPVANIAIPDQTVPTGVAFSVSLDPAQFTDSDAGDTLTYTATLAGGAPLPFGISVDPADGTFSGTIPNGTTATQTIVLTATDSNGATASHTFDVTPDNPPSVANANPDASILSGVVVNVPIPPNTFSDDIGTPTLSVTVDGVALGPNPTPGNLLAFNASTNTIYSNDVVPGILVGDVFTIVVTATDQFGATASDTVLVTVAQGPNIAPELTDPSDDLAASASVGNAFSFTVPGNNFFDQDGDALTVSATLNGGAPLPGWLNFDPTTGVFSGAPGISDTGNLNIDIVASDGNGGTVTDAFALSVTALPVPQITNTTTGPGEIDIIFDENTDVTGFTATSDIPATWSLTGPDAGLFSIDNNGVLTVADSAGFDHENPTGTNEANVFSFNIVATNANGSSSVSMHVDINDVSELPSWLVNASEYGIGYVDGDQPGDGVHTLLDSDHDNVPGAPNYGSEAHWEGEGSYNTPTNLTYSFVAAGGDMDTDGAGGSAPITLTQTLSNSATTFMTGVFGLIESFSNITFTEAFIEDAGDIQIGAFTQAELGTTALGFAYQPINPFVGSSISAQSSTGTANDTIGDIFLNADAWQGDGFQFAYGDENNTFTHELAHALGLDHPFNSAGGANSGFYPIDSANTATNYTGASTGGGHQSAQTDTMVESIMTYHNPYLGFSSIGGIGGGATAFGYTNTPWGFGIEDIAALQHLYGANMTHATGDDVYMFGDSQVFGNIWDAGGTDAIAHTGSQSAIINLNEGEFSSVGFHGGASYEIYASQFGASPIVSFVLDEATDGLVTVSSTGSLVEFIPNYSALNGIDGDMTGVLTFMDGTTQNISLGDLQPDLTHTPGNIGIAYGVTIENAFGGDADDIIIGNGALNVLAGGGGDDILTGGGGADAFFYEWTADGDTGHDTITDFVSGTDIVAIDTTGTVTGAASGGDFVLTLSGSDTITILGVTSMTAGVDYDF